MSLILGLNGPKRPELFVLELKKIAIFDLTLSQTSPDFYVSAV